MSYGIERRLPRGLFVPAPGAIGDLVAADDGLAMAFDTPQDAEAWLRGELEDEERARYDWRFPELQDDRTEVKR